VTSLLDDLRSLVNNPAAFPDVTFYVGSHPDPVYAHKAILCVRSDHFRAMFTSGMRETSGAVVHYGGGGGRGGGSGSGGTATAVPVASSPFASAAVPAARGGRPPPAPISSSSVFAGSGSVSSPAAAAAGGALHPASGDDPLLASLSMGGVEWSREAFIAMLEFLYTGSVVELTPPVAAELMGLADHATVDGLKALCEASLTHSVDTGNVCALLVTAHRYCAGDLKRFCVEFILKHHEAISLLELATEPALLIEITKEVLARKA